MMILILQSASKCFRGIIGRTVKMKNIKTRVGEISIVVVIPTPNTRYNKIKLRTIVRKINTIACLETACKGLHQIPVSFLLCVFYSIFIDCNIF